MIYLIIWQWPTVFGPRVGHFNKILIDFLIFSLSSRFRYSGNEAFRVSFAANEKMCW